VSGSSPSLRPAAIAARLRAAGCVFAEEEARLLIAAAPAPADLEVMVERRIGGLPLEHVIGWAEFCGLRISVDPGVFVPRHRSEFLVSQAAACAAAGVVVLDLCCGSGALGAALAAAVGPIELHAADIDPAAVRCAERNLAAMGGRVYCGDLFHPLPPSLRGRVDVLVANVPYVPTDEIPLLPREARLYEPLPALDGGSDGLDLVRRVAAGAPLWLAPGGHLLVETGDHQADATAAIFADSGLVPEVASLEEIDATVVIGAMRAAPTR
jgi:release factor glutamine methyltransferase